MRPLKICSLRYPLHLSQRNGGENRRLITSALAQNVNYARPVDLAYRSKERHGSPMATVRAECGACSGTGLYRGMAEPEGVAVICLTCKGTGCKEMIYIPFTRRRRRNGVQSVQQSRGSFILSCGPVGESMTYAEFERRIPSP